MPELRIVRGRNHDPVALAADDERHLLHMGDGAWIVRVNMNETTSVVVLGILCLVLIGLLLRRNAQKS
jgi:hypothetical protein